jgi:uncharacterized protein with HEPN domain
VSRSDDGRLADIAEAAVEIADIVSRGRGAWDADRISQLAVERLLEIIGESARSPGDNARPRYADVDWTHIIGLRAVLAHHYHRVDPNQVWVIASVEVPRLADQLKG